MGWGAARQQLRAEPVTVGEFGCVAGRSLPASCVQRVARSAIRGRGLRREHERLPCAQTIGDGDSGDPRRSSCTPTMPTASPTCDAGSVTAASRCRIARKGIESEVRYKRKAEHFLAFLTCGPISGKGSRSPPGGTAASGARRVDLPVAGASVFSASCGLASSQHSAIATLGAFFAVRGMWTACPVFDSPLFLSVYRDRSIAPMAKNSPASGRGRFRSAG